MTQPVITRREAIARGLDRYFTGKPCRRGHVAERTMHNGCVVCQKARCSNYTRPTCSDDSLSPPEEASAALLSFASKLAELDNSIAGERERLLQAFNDGLRLSRFEFRMLGLLKKIGAVKQAADACIGETL